jgi:hypothetical protein
MNHLSRNTDFKPLKQSKRGQEDAKQQQQQQQQQQRWQEQQLYSFTERLMGQKW